MNQSPHTHYADGRKIDPSRSNGASDLKPDGTPNDNNRTEVGPTQLAFDEWQAAGLQIPNLPQMRQDRLDRIQQEVIKRDLAGVLMFDPLNIRYASDAPNMQVWNTHNMFRACFVAASGYMIVWDYKNDMITAHNPLIRETLSGAGCFYFCSGDGVEQDAKRFARNFDAIVREHAGTNRRIAIDKIMISGFRALEKFGFEISDGEEVMEKARSIKQVEEIHAMKCAIHACEMGVAEMHKNLAPGMTEVEVWSILHRENIRRGGEWIECRLACSGPRTNPWLQEAGPRVMDQGEFFAFDTDLVGCYGICADISRTWLIGDLEPTREQQQLYTDAWVHIQENMQLLKPGTSFKEITFGGNMLNAKYVENRYPVKMHGVGLCDEWPSIYYPEDYSEGKFDSYCLEPGMVLCVECYTGEEGGTQGVKLEEQVLITEDGYENLTHYPFEEKLLLTRS